MRSKPQRSGQSREQRELSGRRSVLELAVEDYERVLDKLSALPKNSLDLAYALQGLGGTLVSLGRLEEAEAALVRLRDVMVDKQPDGPDIAAVCFNLAHPYSYSARGDHEAAVFELQRVRVGRGRILCWRGGRSPRAPRRRRASG